MEEPPITVEAVDINSILKILPHRYPFLLVDRIVNIRGDSQGIGIKNVTINEPVFQGHFPERPVFPGVLVIEGMAQTAGVIGLLSMGEEAGDPDRVLSHDRQMQISQACFSRADH